MKKIVIIFSCIIAVLSGCSAGYAEISGEITAEQTTQEKKEYSLWTSIEEELPDTCFTPETEPEPDLLPESDPGPEYAGFFLENKIHEMNIEINVGDWAMMIGNPYSDTYYHADITIDGTVMKDAGIHPRGKTSLELGISYGKNRLPFKIKFNKFNKEASFLGLDELCLDNSACDPSLLRQYVGSEAFRALGVNAPYVCFFDVYLNGNLHGLYVGIEAVDSSFLERSFGSRKHSLYKADSNADLTTGMSMSALVQKKGKDESKDDIKNLISVIDETPAGEKGRIEDVIDVDLVLRNFAVNAVLHNWDDYAGESSHNYYLYMSDGVFRMIPWDLNEILLQTESGEREGPGSAQDIITPVTGYVSEKDRPLVSKLLAVDEYYRKYIGYCASVTDWLEEFCDTRLDGLHEMLDEHHLNDPTKVYSYASFTRQFDENDRNGLAGFIKERCAYLNTRIPEILAEKKIISGDE